MSDVTELLLDWNTGAPEAQAELMERVHAELTSIAARHLARERNVLDADPRSLVNEAYLRLIDLDRVEWRDRTHFFAMASTLMRRILIDESRKRGAAKRDGGVQVTLSSIIPGDDGPTTNALMLHAALERLASADPERARIVELRYFGGLTIEETAQVLQLSPSSVKRSWEVARGWLHRALSSGLDA